jgi:hypothetical protein
MYLNTDPITYWAAMHATGHPLARMAINFLSIPGVLLTDSLAYLELAATSTDVECAFSKGGLTVSKMRHSLSDESTRAATVLGSWCDIPDLIPCNDVVSVFKDKSKRAGKGKAAELTIAKNIIDVDMVTI